MTRKLKVTSGLTQETSLSVIMLNPESTRTCREKYVDVNRTTFSLLDVLFEKKIEEYWNVDGENYLMILQKEKPHQGYT